MMSSLFDSNFIMFITAESTRADWLKIVFVQLDGDTEPVHAVDVMMAQAKRIYILIIKVNKLFSFSCPGVF